MTVDQLIAQLEAFKQNYGGTSPIVVNSSEYMRYDYIGEVPGHTEVVVDLHRLSDYEEYDQGVHDPSHAIQVFVVT